MLAPYALLKAFWKNCKLVKWAEKVKFYFK